ncbi:MAG TPA: hypothetical protein VKW78_06685 [Terriglobales bacterium]|nr:hypothetical protein [Terriglobales bacterium]
MTLVPPVLRPQSTITVQLGSYVAEIRSIRHAKERKINHCYAILTGLGEKVYESGNGFLSVCSVVEKAAQHLETLWEFSRG